MYVGIIVQNSLGVVILQISTFSKISSCSARHSLQILINVATVTGKQEDLGY